MSVAEPVAIATEDRLAVIVPLYNEERTVVELLDRLITEDVVSQLIIVDDGSTDNSILLVKEWLDASQSARNVSISLMTHDRNRGKGRAIRMGLEHVRCSHVIIQDADLEYDPADISRLWGAMMSGSADVIFGSRYLKKSGWQQGRMTMQLGVRTLNLLVRVMYGVKLTDEATCYKMFRTADLRNMSLECESFEFCPEVISKAIFAGLKIRELPISYVHRTREEGKKIGVRDGLTAIWWLVRYRVRMFTLLRKRKTNRNEDYNLFCDSRDGADSGAAPGTSW